MSRTAIFARREQFGAKANGVNVLLPRRKAPKGPNAQPEGVGRPHRIQIGWSSADQDHLFDITHPIRDYSVKVYP